MLLTRVEFFAATQFSIVKKAIPSPALRRAKRLQAPADE
jgi:hypothetical protein